MPRLQVIRPFAFADDGITPKMLREGEEFVCPDELAPGLIKARMARPAGLGDEHPFGEPKGSLGDAVREIQEMFADDQDDDGAAAEVDEADEASNDAGEDGDDDQDEDDDGEAEKEAREPIENKDAGDTDGSSAGKRGKRASKGA